MSFLRLDGVTLAYAGGAPVLRDVTLHLDAGWTGVVGENGSGKSTLLLALAGVLPLAEGALHCGAAPVLYVPQRVDAPDPRVLALAADWSKAALRWRARLSLEDDGVERWATLSEGQRKRWQIAAALAARPGALLLDEPTNHLDGEAREVLLAALEGFDGVGVVVSHDRDLLERLTRRTVRVAGGGATLYRLPFSAARAEWAQAEAAARATRAAAAEKVRRLAGAVDEARRETRAAATSRSARHRMKSKQDSDARGVGADFRAARAEKHLASRGGALVERLRQAEAAIPEGPREKPVGRPVGFEGRRAARARVVTLERQVLTAGERVLLEEVTLVLERGQKVHLAGPNGSGKSTLLRCLRDRAAVPEARRVLVPQDLTAAEAEALVGETLALPPEARGRVLELTAALGLDPAGLVRGQPPTPGQAKKLALASALGRGLELLLLDEPTNHLDLPAIERLESALASLDAALVLVTHDPELAAASTGVTWELGGGALSVR